MSHSKKYLPMEKITRMNFCIIESKVTKDFTVTLTFTNSLKPTAEEFISHLFPIEFYSAQENQIDKEQRSITITTTNKEMVESLRKMVTKWFRQKSQLDNINYN